MRYLRYTVLMLLLVFGLFGCETTAETTMETTASITESTTESTTTQFVTITDSQTIDPSIVLRNQAQVDADAFMAGLLNADRIVIENNVAITVHNSQDAILANAGSSFVLRYDFVNQFEEAVIILDGVKTEALALTLNDYYILTFLQSGETRSAGFSTTDISSLTTRQTIAEMYEYVYLPFGRTYSKVDGVYSFEETLSSSPSTQVQTMALMLQTLGATEAEIASAMLSVTTGFFPLEGEMVFRVELMDFPIASLSGLVDASLELNVTSPDELSPSGMFADYYTSIGVFSYEEVSVILEANTWNESFFIASAPPTYYSVWLEPGYYVIETMSGDAIHTTVDLLDCRLITASNSQKLKTYEIETAGQYYYTALAQGTGFGTIKIRKLTLNDIGDYDSPIPLPPSTNTINEGPEDFQYYLFEDERDGFMAITIEHADTGGDLEARIWLYKGSYTWIQESVDGNVYVLYRSGYKLAVEITGNYVGEYTIHADFVPRPAAVSNPTNNPTLMTPITSEYGEVIVNGLTRTAPNHMIYIMTPGSYRLDLNVLVGSPIVRLYSASMVEIQNGWTGELTLQPGYYIVKFSYSADWDVNAFQAKLTKVEPT